MKKMNRFQTQEELNLRCWKDPAFKKKLISSPREALQEMGMKNIPPSIQIQVVEENPNAWYIVLYPAPPNAKNLPDQELKKIAAAGGYINPLSVTEFAS